ncbi:hypothetical protein [Capnocytophaga catalasegens]|nr:hypothetical protein [Capnocytophaga catalasegens]
MTVELKNFCQKITHFTEEELALVDTFFEGRAIKKRDFLAKEGSVCD